MEHANYTGHLGDYSRCVFSPFVEEKESETCTLCEGSGQNPDAPECAECDGSGERWLRKGMGPDAQLLFGGQCGMCRGTGLELEPCSRCDGGGEL